MDTKPESNSYTPNPSLKQLFDQMNAGIAQCGVEGFFTEVNDRYCEMTGYSRSELLQKKMGMITHPDDLVVDLPLLHECVTNGKNFIIQKRYIRKDGTEIWVKNSVSRITDNDGNYFLTAVSIDITDQVMARTKLAASEARYKQLAAQLDMQVRQRTAELQRSHDDLQQFAHVISHDLKEPIRRQKVFLERFITAYQSLLPIEGFAALQKMEKGIDRVYSMIGSILHYSESVDDLPYTDDIDLCELAHEVITDLDLLVEETGGVIHCDSIPTIPGCRPLLGQLLFNLLSNSLKFRRPDVPPVIHITGAPSGGYLHLRVVDNGIGFARSDAEKIFDIYTRLHARSQYDGTGLGLSLCRKIVERHGGTITAEGHRGQGAIIHIYLPLQRAN